MSIKKFVLIGLIFSFVVGCSDENRPFQSLPVAKLKGVSCLTNASEIFSIYFVAKMSATEVEEFWDCTDRAVRLFDEYVSGKREGEYHPREIYDFVNNFFFSDLRIPDKQVDDLLKEMMYFKMLLVGGNEKVVTSAEIIKFRSWIQFLKSETLLLRPHIRLLNWYHNKSQPTPEQLEESLQVLNGVAHRLGEKFGQEKYVYNRERIVSLFEKMDVIFESAPKEPMRLDRWVPLAFNVKQALVGNNIQAMVWQDWQPLTVALSDGFSVFLNWHYFVAKSETWYQSSSIAAIGRIKDRSLALLARGFAVEDRGKIPNSVVLQIMMDLERLDVLPSSWGASEIGYLWLILNAQVLNSTFSGEVDWKKLREKFLEDKSMAWAQALKGIVGQMFGQSDQLFPSIQPSVLEKVSTVIDEWSSVQLELNQQAPNRRSFICPAVIQTAIDQMNCIAATPWPLNLDSMGRLEFFKGGKYTSDTLSTLNWERQVMDVLIKGYADVFDRDKKPAGLSENRLRDLFFDLKPALVKLGLVDADNFNFYKRVFLEGNLFLARGDGDISHFNLYESVEYLHYALAGIRAGGRLLDHLETSCDVNKVGEKVVSVPVECFRWHFKEQFEKNFSHMPQLIQFVSGLPDSEWEVLEKNLESTIRAEGAADSPILTSDILEIFILLQYIETFIFRFDVSGSQSVELEEVGPALKVFVPTLSRLLQFDPVLQAWDLEATFTYLLRYGLSPLRDDDPVAGLEYIYWKWHPETWEFRADRQRLAQILAALAKLRGSPAL